jgi:hypothetical protein
MVVTLKLATHTRFWTFNLVLSIAVLSLGLYVAYMWISNYALSNDVQNTSFVAWTTP